MLDSSQDLVLHAAGSLLTLHAVAALVEVLHVRQAERTTAVLIGLKLGYSGLGVFDSGEFDNTGAARATVRLVLNLRALDFADRGEELD